MQVVYALTILIDEERRRLCVTGFNPVGEKPSFVSFIPKILIKISVSDFLKRINLIGWD